jgi:hypothetical protein
MWRPWSVLLESLGRLRFRLPRQPTLVVGAPGAPDARGGSGWEAFAAPEALFAVWGPLEGSPWEPYHCIPLFAALEQVARSQLGPTDPNVIAAERAGEGGGFVLPEHARPGAPTPPWIDRGTWVMIDLPGRSTVEAATWLVSAGAVQPVCTFDHWPHPKGVLKADRILAELLRFASTIATARGRISGSAPPLWICDAERLGTRSGTPGEFDNRYYLDDSILPGPNVLRAAGIRRVVHVSSRTGAGPLPDLERYFADLRLAGLEVLHVDVEDPGLEPRPSSVPAVPRSVSKWDFRRSSAGGFGTEVPEPSSSGG